MPFSGTTYAQISSGADEVEELIATFSVRMANARLVAGDIVSSMTALGTEWGPIVAAAAALLAADTGNVGKQALNSHVQNLLTDFNSVLAEAQALDTLINT